VDTGQTPSHKRLLQKRLHFLGRRLNAAQRTWRLIENGDRILLGLSGGKDSLTLLHLLLHWRQSAPVDFTLAAMHLETDGAPDRQGLRPLLRRHLERCGLEFFCTVPAAEPAQVPDGRPAHPCFRCAWKRREALFRFASSHQFNKVAMGHHLDDAAQTILLNLLFHGHLDGILPRREFFGGRIVLIRPLILAEEKEVRRVATLLDFPFVLCDCPHGTQSQREHVKAFLNSFGPRASTIKRRLWRASLPYESRIRETSCSW
jgi:tRNA(Ile)-lysidine synthase TilS/MesJ